MDRARLAGDVLVARQVLHDVADAPAAGALAAEGAHAAAARGLRQAPLVAVVHALRGVLDGPLAFLHQIAQDSGETR